MTTPPGPAAPGMMPWRDPADGHQTRFRRTRHWLTWLAAPHAARQIQWPLTARWLAASRVLVTGAALLAVAAAMAATPVRGADLALFGMLVGCGAVSAVLTGRPGEPGAAAEDVHVQGVWDLPTAALLPPMYALTAPVSRLLLTWWRTRQPPRRGRVLAAAAAGLASGFASAAFHAVASRTSAKVSGSAGEAALWTLLVVCCGLLRLAASDCLLSAPAKASVPVAARQARASCRERLVGWAAELCTGALVTYAAAHGTILVPFALPLAVLLQRSLRHPQLLGEARVDGKTGLLNATAWQREASAEIARAARTGAPLAVAIADADRFKAVNDTHGHLVGDQVLAAIAGKLRQALRSYDVIGRFGGEEFAMVLPGTTLQEAREVTERLRQAIAGATIPADDRGRSLRVTVSVGIAALNASRRDLTGLLGAADAALLRAKDGGRNRVRVADDTEPTRRKPQPGGAAVTAAGVAEHDAGRARAEPGRPLMPIDATVAHPARIWNYWLGSKDHYDVDRAAGDQYARAFPQITDIARQSRYFLARVVRYLAAEADVRQFLDIGTGLPVGYNTHEVAQRIAPDCKIVYVDNDPLVLAHAHALLATAPEGRYDYVDADLREPAMILTTAARTLDLDQPVAIMLMGVLGHISDDAEAAAIVGHLIAALPRGGFLALYDSIDTVRARTEVARGYAAIGAVPYRLRSAGQILGFLTGLDLVEPGLVPITCWRPDPGLFRLPELPTIGAVGKKCR